MSTEPDRMIPLDRLRSVSKTMDKENQRGERGMREGRVQGRAKSFRKTHRRLFYEVPMLVFPSEF